jgi:hypothetical protein
MVKAWRHARGKIEEKSGFDGSVVRVMMAFSDL